jgi:ABC-type sugar transport system ATPase subunit
MNAFALEAEGISKFFPGVKALDNVSLRVRPGTVHALMGKMVRESRRDEVPYRDLPSR